MLYRVFPRDPGAGHRADGGALWVPRERQGTGRHDNPELYGALYASRDPVSAVAERIQAFRGQSLTDADLARPGGRRLAIATIDDGGVPPPVDLDEPAELLRLGLRPSSVATGRRPVTQATAAALFRQGAVGLSWWSMLEASWTNVTLFAERAVRRLRVEGDPEPLTTAHPAMREAAEQLGIALR